MSFAPPEIVLAKIDETVGQIRQMGLSDDEIVRSVIAIYNVPPLGVPAESHHAMLVSTIAAMVVRLVHLADAQG